MNISILYHDNLFSDLLCLFYSNYLLGSLDIESLFFGISRVLCFVECSDTQFITKFLLLELHFCKAKKSKENFTKNLKYYTRSILGVVFKVYKN